MKLSEICLAKEASIKDAMIRIGETCENMVVIVDDRMRLIGIVTDGDIRRYLISGGGIGDSVLLAVNSNPISADIQTSREEIVDLLKSESGITKIPLVNGDGTVVGLHGMEVDEYIPIYDVKFDGNERLYVNDAIDSSYISSVGKYIRSFEKSFSDFTGLDSCLSVSNGTVALDLAFACIGLDECDHVIVPDLTFVSPLNAAIRTGAEVSLIDCQNDLPVPSVSDYLNALRSNTKAVVVVHLYGFPFDVKLLKERLPDDILVIEDCAEAFGSYYHGHHVGYFSDFATFSFFGNKTITTGEGGMLYCRNEKSRELANLLKNHGMRPDKRYIHEAIGFNFRLTNLQAAIGLGQLESAKSILDAKSSIFDEYRSMLDSYGFKFIGSPDYGINSQWLVIVSHAKFIELGVDKIMHRLKQIGIDSRPVFYPLSSMQPYCSFKDYSSCNSNYFNSSFICLPSFPSIKVVQIQRVCSAMINIIDQ